MSEAGSSPYHRLSLSPEEFGWAVKGRNHMDAVPAVIVRVTPSHLCQVEGDPRSVLTFLLVIVVAAAAAALLVTVTV